MFRESHPFCRKPDDIRLIFPVILGSHRVSRKWNVFTKKKSLLQGASWEMSSSATTDKTAEKREVHASGLLLRMLMCTATFALGHLHSPRVEKRRHD